MTNTMKSLTNNKLAQAGFTLIELLIVILIIGVLSGIAIYAVDPFSDLADDTATQTQDEMDKVCEAAEKAGIIRDEDSDC